MSFLYIFSISVNANIYRIHYYKGLCLYSAHSSNSSKNNDNGMYYRNWN